MHTSRENYSSLENTSELNIDITTTNVYGDKNESNILKKLRKTINPNSDLAENMNK